MHSQVTLSPLDSVDFADVLGSLFPVNLRVARNTSDNAIEYRNIMLLGAQGSGKTTTAQALAWALGQKYGITNTVFAIQIAGLIGYYQSQPKFLVDAGFSPLRT